MSDLTTTEWERIADELHLPADGVRRTVQLLDEGNTVPFITRFRKDQTGGFDDQQVRAIERGVLKLRTLERRKQTILKTIDSQGKLSETLKKQIEETTSSKRLEDLYLPYKPRRQTMAAAARQRGLAPLAQEVLEGVGEGVDLEARVATLIRPEKGLHNAEQVLEGVGHLIAEEFSDRADLRARLRRIMHQSSRLVSVKAESPGSKPAPDVPSKSPANEEPANEQPANEQPANEQPANEQPANEQPANEQPANEEPANEEPANEEPANEEPTNEEPTNEEPTNEEPTNEEPANEEPASEEPVSEEPANEEPANEQPANEEPLNEQPANEQPVNEEPLNEEPLNEDPAGEKPVEKLDYVDQIAAVEVADVNRVEDAGDAEAHKAHDSRDQETPDQPTKENVAVELTDVTASAEERQDHDEGGSHQNVGVSEESVAQEPHPTDQIPLAEIAAVPQNQQDEPEVAAQNPPTHDSADATITQSPTSLEESSAATTESKEEPSAPSDDGQTDLKGGQAQTPPESVSTPPPYVTQKKAPESNRKSRQEKKRQALENAFKEYFDYSEAIEIAPPHRVLAVNRGERAKILKAKIESDQKALCREAENLLIPPHHPHADFLRTCLHDALGRLVIPSLEREIRREMTDKAEAHALEVFARNLRELLLQPPVTGRNVLAIDPGYKRGCKIVVLDEFGNLVDWETVYMVGPQPRRQKSRERLQQLARRHKVRVIAIGNGAGSREAEQVTADLLASDLKDLDIDYMMVNEAGASVYSICDIGREELPGCDPRLRSAVSIGRRLLDPLSELVKINPAHIGVGMYQHDIKSKHLQSLLDAVVESCVNFVGVDVNTASPALLRYVSGLNQLTARRLYEHRQTHGPFRSREQFKQVSGFGPNTFVQVAGFLRIVGGDNPLDATSIHPESYEHAKKVLDLIHVSDEQLNANIPPSRPGHQPIQKAHKKKGARPQGELETPLATPEATPKEASEKVGTITEVENQTVEGDGPSSVDSAADATPPPQEGESLPAADLAIPAGESKAAPVSKEPVSKEPASPSPGADVLAKQIAALNAEMLSVELGIGKMLLQDILEALKRPGRDPRFDLPAPPLRRSRLKLEDLKPGDCLTATVLNVVDFGAFVDIGTVDSGLIHISKLADRYIKDPHEIVGVGDILRVWVVGVDMNRRRVSLTAISPDASKTERSDQDERKPRRQRGGGRPQAAARGGQRTGKPSGSWQGEPGRGKPATQPASQGSRPSKEGRSARTTQAHEGPRGKKVRPPKFQAVRRKSPPPKKKPITKAMAEGREPMRSFSDLKQLFELQKEENVQSEKPQESENRVDEKPPEADAGSHGGEK